MDWSMPGFFVLYYLPEFAQTHVHWVGDAIQPSQDPTILSSAVLFVHPQSLLAAGPFPMRWLFASGGQSIGT